MKQLDGARPAPPVAITELAPTVERLPPSERTRFDRLLHVGEATGELVAPPAMHAWIAAHFGSLGAVAAQKIVKTTNLVTFEGTLFNALRAARPMTAAPEEELDTLVGAEQGDPFCHPLDGTPADVFGRLQGAHAVTASNVAKYDAWHGLVIYQQHDPLRFTHDAIGDYLELGLRWGREALAHDPTAPYCLLLWNCLWRSGASILHGHAQVVCSRDMHYARVESLRRAALRYRAEHGEDYFVDLYAAHAAVGLTVEGRGVRLMASLTPVKEKEVWLFADAVGPALGEGVYRVLDCFVHRLGVTSFNLVLYLPPLAPVPEDWSGFPVIARLVDRGPLGQRTADVGAMELYASSVVSSDPFRLMPYLQEAFA